MCDRPDVFLFHEQDARQLAGFVASLESIGFRVRRCAGRRQLMNALRTRAPGEGGIAVLIAAHARNCEAARDVSVLYPGVAIVARIPDFNEAVHVEALSSGAHACVPAGASCRWWRAALFALRRRPLPVVRPGLPVSRSGRWSLREQGWTLVCPQGTAQGLTTQERAFFEHLRTAPDHRAARSELLAAVSTAAGDGRMPADTYLSLLVSRIRHKFRRNGTSLPLKSLHGWGYMFAEALHGNEPMQEHV